jgi:hypothetical protein
MKFGALGAMQILFWALALLSATIRPLDSAKIAFSTIRNLNKA